MQSSVYDRKVILLSIFTEKIFKMINQWGGNEEGVEWGGEIFRFLLIKFRII